MVIALSPGKAQQVFQPQTISSKYHRLTTTPTDRWGKEGTQLQLNKGTDIMWHQHIDVAVAQADVSDEGVVIACGYSSVSDKKWPVSVAEDGSGYLVIQIIDQSGQLQWSQAIKRQNSMRMHGLPEPSCQQVMVNDHLNQVYVWNDINQGQTKALAFDLTSFQFLSNVSPELPNHDHITSVGDVRFHDLPESPHFIAEIHGWVHEENEKGDGNYGYLSDALFVVMDNQGNKVWDKQLMGSLDSRSMPEQNSMNRVFAQTHGLVKVSESSKEFKVMNFNAKEQLTFVWSEQGIEAKDKTLLQWPIDAFKSSIDSSRLPTLVSSVAKPLNDRKACKGYAAVDTLADGSLLLFDDKKKQVDLVLFNDGQDGKFTSPLIEIPPEWYQSDFVSGQAMFVGTADSIHINLGEQTHAVFSENGTLKEKIDFKGVSKDLNLWTSGENDSYWAEGYHSGIHLYQRLPTRFVHQSETAKDNQGMWIEYISEMHVNDSGELLASGKAGIHDHKLYLFDPMGQPLMTLNTGHEYIRSATSTADHIYFSAIKQNEVMQFDKKGLLLNRFMTPNKEQITHLHATGNHLYVLTASTVFLYQEPE